MQHLATIQIWSKKLLDFWVDLIAIVGRFYVVCEFGLASFLFGDKKLVLNVFISIADEDQQIGTEICNFLKAMGLVVGLLVGIYQTGK